MGRTQRGVIHVALLLIATGDVSRIEGSEIEKNETLLSPAPTLAEHAEKWVKSPPITSIHCS